VQIIILLFAVLLVALAFLGLGFNIFFRKDGKFPEREVGKNRQMRKLNISCARCEELARYRKKKIRINPGKLKIVR